MTLNDFLSEESIMERVDAYSIYSYYIGAEQEIGKAYRSPLRTDDDMPSFALFWHKDVLLFKDHGIGLKGNVFSFVKYLFGYTTSSQVLSRINADFDLELLGGTEYQKNGKAPILNGHKTKSSLTDIKIASKSKHTLEFNKFWKLLDVTKPVLDYYEVKEPSILYFEYEDGKVYTIYPKGLCIAYPIYDKFKIYSPYDKINKFRNNYPLSYIEGYLQLKYVNDFCILTKSWKEVIFFRQHFDWDTVSGKSENTIISRFMMMRLVQKFKYMLIWMDNDVAGQRAQRRYLQEYPFLIPVYYNVPQKDPTDRYMAIEDKASVLREIENLIKNSLNK